MIIFPPSMLRIRVIEPPKKSIHLWLPLCLIWAPLVALWLALLPIILIVALLLWPGGQGKTVLLLGPRAFRVFCAMRGLSVHVEEARGRKEILILCC